MLGVGGEGGEGQERAGVGADASQAPAISNTQIILSFTGALRYLLCKTSGGWTCRKVHLCGGVVEGPHTHLSHDNNGNNKPA